MNDFVDDDSDIEESDVDEIFGDDLRVNEYSDTDEFFMKDAKSKKQETIDLKDLDLFNRQSKAMKMLNEH